MRIWVLAAMITAAIAGCSSTRNQDELLLEKTLPRLVEAGDVTGIAVAVVVRGEPTRTLVYGVRHAETGEPVREDTVFEAASLSKPVFAYAVMRMVERGELDLDRPLATYLPYERLEHDERYKRITARTVLSHSSGLPNWGGTPIEMVFDPGERFGYSGEGFVYLQKVVETITGMTLDEFAAQEVFGPLGMTGSTYVWREELNGQMATGHTSRGEPLEKKRRPGGDGNAAASLLTTARDYAIFLSAVLNREGLGPLTWERIFEPAVQVAEIQAMWKGEKGRPFENVYWGLGWGLQLGEAGKAFFHWGDNPGYKNYVIGYPGEGRALVYLTNSDEGLSIAEPVVAAFVPDSNEALHWLDYERYDAPTRLVRRSLERAYFEEGGQAGTVLYHALLKEHPDLDFEPVMDRLGFALLRDDALDEAIAVFRLNVDAHPESSSVHDSLAEAYMTAGQDDLAIESFERSHELDPGNENADRCIPWIREGRRARMSAPRWPEAALEHLVGSYGPFRFSLRDGSLFASIEWKKKDYCMVPLSEDTFALEGYGSYRMRFVRDGKGNVVKAIGLRCSGPTTEAMREP